MSIRLTSYWHYKKALGVNMTCLFTDWGWVQGGRWSVLLFSMTQPAHRLDSRQNPGQSWCLWLSSPGATYTQVKKNPNTHSIPQDTKYRCFKEKNTFGIPLHYESSLVGFPLCHVGRHLRLITLAWWTSSLTHCLIVSQCQWNHEKHCIALQRQRETLSGR